MAPEPTILAENLFIREPPQHILTRFVIRVNGVTANFLEKILRVIGDEEKTRKARRKAPSRLDLPDSA